MRRVFFLLLALPLMAQERDLITLQKVAENDEPVITILQSGKAFAHPSLHVCIGLEFHKATGKITNIVPFFLAAKTAAEDPSCIKVPQSAVDALGEAWKNAEGIKETRP